MTDKPEDPREQLHFHKGDREPSQGTPWHDDALKRSEIAEELTNLVRGQHDPYTISIHGGWGTGKTFLLRRWQKDLENNDFKCIYYNAWEDDYHLADPLISIIGQLSEHLKNDVKRSLITKIKKSAKPLFFDAAKNAAEIAITHSTGLQINLQGIIDKHADILLKQYSAKNESIKNLIDSLTEMSSQVKDSTGQPLIFIIDELDRCRPTFAIELLERVKHIFEIKNIVFVFGVNREQLSETIKSVYGNIDSDTYLRRFFNMELTLPQANAGLFFDYLIEEHNLKIFFRSLTNSAQHNKHVQNFDTLRSLFSDICESFALSLRDIQNCMNTIVFVGKTIKNREFMHPHVIALLIALRLKEKTLYEEFRQGNCPAGKLMDYLHGKLYKSKQLVSTGELPDNLYHETVTLEAFLYNISVNKGEANTIFTQIQELGESKIIEEPKEDTYLSKKVHSDLNYRERVAYWTDSFRDHLTDQAQGIPLDRITRLFDISHSK